MDEAANSEAALRVRERAEVEKALMQASDHPSIPVKFVGPLDSSGNRSPPAIAASTPIPTPAGLSEVLSPVVQSVLGYFPSY